jgi:hypothetical protein
MRARTLLAVAMLVLAAACTGDDGAATGPTTPSGEAPPTSDVEGRIVPGEWTYEYLGVKASFEWKDGPASLTVKNGSDRPVGAPSIYVVTKDQRHIDGKVDGSAPLDPSASGKYEVSFPGGLRPDDVGLIVLVLGDVNWGALGPKIVGT